MAGQSAGWGREMVVRKRRKERKFSGSLADLRCHQLSGDRLMLGLGQEDAGSFFSEEKGGVPSMKFLY